MAACSALRTMLTSCTPSARQILFSIWPRFEAAAVWIRAVWPSRRIASTMLSAVIGLTNIEAPSAAVAPSGSTVQPRAGTVRYCVYMPPPTTLTSLPSIACALAPARTTRPAPSLPTAMDCPSRAAMAGIACGGMSATSIGLSALPEAASVESRAGPSSKPSRTG